MTSVLVFVLVLVSGVSFMQKDKMKQKDQKQKECVTFQVLRKDVAPSRRSYCSLHEVSL